MGQLVRISDRFRPPEVALIRRMNPDLNSDEFEQFVHTAAKLGLDPLRKQVYAFVFSKDNKERRKMAIVIGIDGFRAVAKRSGEYRPDDKPPRFHVDEKLKGPTNPLGLISAEVSVHQHAHESWFEVPALVFWDEFAPIVEQGEWKDVQKDRGQGTYRKFVGTGKMILDPKRDAWVRMPRLMLAKVAEAQAIRRAWPEEFSGIYGEEEMDRAKTIDLTATEIADAAEIERRLQAVGADNAILFDMGEGLERVPIGKAHDMVMERLSKMKDEEVLAWRDLNRIPLQEFWARAKTDALSLKTFFEKIEKRSK